MFKLMIDQKKSIVIFPIKAKHKVLQIKMLEFKKTEIDKHSLSKQLFCREQ